MAAQAARLNYLGIAPVHIWLHLLAHLVLYDHLFLAYIFISEPLDNIGRRQPNEFLHLSSAIELMATSQSHAT